jgi:hypothetical protein
LNQINSASAWVASFAFLWIVARLFAWHLGRGSGGTQFEQEDATAIQTLGLGVD